MSKPVKNDSLERIDPALEHALQRLGYSSFIGSQEACVRAVTEGEDVLALLPTGAGKSAIYQVASLAREGVGLVISPLIAIMQQQVETLQGLGVKAEFLNSTQNGAEQNDLYWRLRHNDVEILYMSPEKLLQSSVMGLLEDVPIACIAVDEAHCILRWGRNFRPEYAQLGCLKTVFPNAPIIALTGTLLPNKEQAIANALGLHSPRIVRESISRPNIQLKVSQKKRAKQQLLSFLMKDAVAQPGIVYCRARSKSEELARWLTSQGVSATCYHASMDSDSREMAHQCFAKGKVQVLVATTAYGMGVDLDHVRFVVHMDLPLSLENYVQEVGRAGRDGRVAQALLFYGLQDVMQTWQFVRQEQIEEEFWRLMSCLEHMSCRQNVLLEAFSETPKAPCGVCDRCRSTSKQHNVTIAAQKFLSLVHHTKGVVPFAALIQVLMGKRTKQVLNYRLEAHTLFGAGTALDEIQWKSVVRMLLAKGYLFIQGLSPFSVGLGEECRALLRSEVQLLTTTDWFYPALKDTQELEKPSGSWQKLLQWSVTNRASDYLTEKQLHAIFESNPTSIAALSRLTGLSKDILSKLNANDLFTEQVGEKLDV